ncbi:MAG: outer membrane beta-barrel protein [Limisphaerales bacterium]
MKFNKWTVGLAAIGLVSLTTASRADEKMNQLQTALSDTTISGYVSASANWALDPGANGYQNSLAGGIPFQGPDKQDGFNLDVVKLSISKPQDESPWASGYQVDLMFGPDAIGYNVAGSTSSSLGYYDGYSDFAIKQAYIALRTPIGNGIDWKVGVFDTVIGYEVTDSGNDPNYTRSWGYYLEPTEHTGILGTYKLNDQWTFSAGIANTLYAGINQRPYDYTGNANDDWHKTGMGALTYTTPSSWGWAAGSSLYAGVVYGLAGDTGSYNDYQLNWYGGATLNTPWSKLTTGLAFDYAEHFDAEPVNVWALGLYATYKATDKLSLNGRAEYVAADKDNDSYITGTTPDFMEITATVEYDLWANVISRLELRYDQVLDNVAGINSAIGSGSGTFSRDSVGLYANIIYKF